MSPKHVNMK